MATPNVLIIGNTGKTGSRVESRLKTAGITTRGVSRHSQPEFHWQKKDTWAAVLEGMDSAYVTYHPDLALPESEEDIGVFCDMAKAAGLKHLTLLSGRGEPGARRAEQVLETSGLNWNVVRASWFAQNFSESFMLEGILEGQLVLPDCEAPEPFIDINDIADVAIATLLEPGLHNRLFEVTGPESLTFTEAVSMISQATGNTVKLITVSLEEYLGSLEQAGVPDDIRKLLRLLFSELFDGRNSSTADGVHQALGRPATRFQDYAKATAASGIWLKEKHAV